MNVSACKLIPRHLRLTVAVSVSILWVALPLNSQLAFAADPFADFDEYAEAALRDWNTPAIAVSVVKDGHVVFARGYGVKKLGGNNDVDIHTVFPIASITKTFNATALAMLVEDGKLEWMDPATKHLPDFQLPDRWTTGELRIADLLSHRTGLDDPEFLSYSGVSRDELIRRMRYLPRIAPFRSSFRYNNLGTIVAGEILERISGQSWKDFVRRRILEPLEMSSTVTDVLELQDSKNVATSYVTVNGQLQEDRSWNLPLTEGWSRYRETIRPAGSICSTANDLAKFAIFQLSGGEYGGRRLLKADTIREMQAMHSVAPLKDIPEPNLTYAKIAFGAGFGWLVRDYRGRKLVMHDGSTGTVIGLMPEERTGVVVLTNLGCGVQFMVMHDIFDRLLGIPRTWTNRDFIAHVIDDYQKSIDAEEARLNRERQEHLKPQLELNSYEGTYESELFGQLIVAESKGSLSMQWGPNCRSELVHWSGERFRAKFVLRFPEDLFLTFLPRDGQVAQVTIMNVFPMKEISTFVRVSK